MAKLEDSGWPSLLMEEVSTLWKENWFCDVKIISQDGQKFSAHSIILGAASPVLKVSTEKCSIVYLLPRLRKYQD